VIPAFLGMITICARCIVALASPPDAREGPRQITPHERMRLEIARNVSEIKDEAQREAVGQLVRALAST